MRARLCLGRHDTPQQMAFLSPSLPALSGAFSRNGWPAGQHLLTFDIGQRLYLELKVCVPCRYLPVALLFALN